MLENIIKNTNKIRRKLSLKFLLISYLTCSLFNLFFAKYTEIGLIITTIASFIWMIKNTEKEYGNIRKSVAKYKQSYDLFVVEGIINFKKVFLFILSFSFFVAIQLVLCPSISFSAFLCYFLYVGTIMFLINNTYNPSSLEKQKQHKISFDATHEEYRFSEHLGSACRNVDETWYSDHCLPGNPIFLINK